jgi:hypothetical protein
MEPVWGAMLGVLAAGAAGALTSELACPIRLPMHVMLWHVLPVGIFAVLGAGAALVAAHLFKVQGTKDEGRSSERAHR